MMGGKSWNDWIGEYAKGHQNPVNKITHLFGIPMIAVAVPLFLVSPFVTGLWPWAAGLFLAGWVLQFVGHAFEGRLRSSSRTGGSCWSDCGGGLRKYRAAPEASASIAASQVVELRPIFWRAMIIFMICAVPSPISNPITSRNRC